MTAQVVPALHAQSTTPSGPQPSDKGELFAYPVIVVLSADQPFSLPKADITFINDSFMINAPNQPGVPIVTDVAIGVQIPSGSGEHGQFNDVNSANGGGPIGLIHVKRSFNGMHQVC
jgi:hypothetical protein